MMKNKYNKIKQILFFISILYLTLLLPLLITIYSSSWYEYNYNKQQITGQVGFNNINNATSNLIGFFSYQDNLNSQWNEKEKQHMSEVREIYLKMIIIGIILFVISIFLFDKKLIIKYSTFNLYLISTLFIIIPFFTLIFSGIFHEILFNNNLWIITENDISYYLFPIEFFRNSFVFILFFALIENLVLQLYFKYLK